MEHLVHRGVVIVMKALFLFAIHDGEIDGLSLDRRRDVVKLFEVFGELFQAEAKHNVALPSSYYAASLPP